MYYILHKPYGSDKPWLELPGFRRQREAREVLKALAEQKNEDGSRMISAKLCIGKGRDRRDILIL